MDPEGSPAADSCYGLAEKILEASDGRIVIDVYPGGLLGDWVPVLEEVMRGTIEMQLSCLTGKWDPRLEITFLPFLVKTHDEAAIAFGPGGYLLELFDGIAEATDIKLLVGWDALFNGFSFTSLPPDWGDPDTDKDMKMRIYGGKMRELLTKRWGFTPVALPWADTFTALQTGMVEGVIGGTPMHAWEHHRDVITHWVQYNEVFQLYFFLMNRPLWDSLSEEDQQIILDAANAQSDIDFAVAKEREEEYRQKMRDYGIEVMFPTPEELEVLAASIRDDVWPELGDRYGQALMDEVIAYLKGLR